MGVARRIAALAHQALAGVNAFLEWFDRPLDWRVRQHEDGLWYVEFEHRDHGWVHDPGQGHATMVDAAAAGRKRYGA
jgi:hypothetical protein